MRTLQGGSPALKKMKVVTAWPALFMGNDCKINLECSGSLKLHILHTLLLVEVGIAQAHAIGPFGDLATTHWPIPTSGNRDARVVYPHLCPNISSILFRHKDLGQRRFYPRCYHPIIIAFTSGVHSFHYSANEQQCSRLKSSMPFKRDLGPSKYTSLKKTLQNVN